MNVQERLLLQCVKLPDNSLTPVFILRKQVRLINQKTQEAYQACVVKMAAEVELKNEFISAHRLGVICTKNNQIKSVIICQDMLDTFNKENIKGIAIRVGENVGVLDENAPFKSFASEEQYQKFAAKI